MYIILCPSNPSFFVLPYRRHPNCTLCPLPRRLVAWLRSVVRSTNSRGGVASHCKGSSGTLLFEFDSFFYIGFYLTVCVWTMNVKDEFSWSEIPLAFMFCWASRASMTHWARLASMDNLTQYTVVLAQPQVGRALLGLCRATQFWPSIPIWQNLIPFAF
jgi:hypothetical protein